MNTNTKINQTDINRAVFAGKLVLSGNSHERICDILNMNPKSLDRIINVLLPQVDKSLYEEVMNYISSEHEEKVKRMKSNIEKNLNKIVNKANEEVDSTPSSISNDKENKPSEKQQKRRPDNMTKEELAEKIADYIIEHNCTISEANRQFGISSANMHYVNVVLPTVSEKKFKQVRNIVDSRKKQNTSANVTKAGLEKVQYEFKGTDGEPMYNSTAICKYVLDCKVCSLNDVAKHFSISENEAYENIQYMERLDKNKYETVYAIVIRGHYTGEGYVRGRNRFDKEQNCHKICDYIIVNTARVQEAEKFFGVDKQTIRKSIENMAEYDYDKYLAVKNIQILNSNGTKIKPNPNAVVDDPSIACIKNDTGFESAKDLEIPAVNIDGTEDVSAYDEDPDCDVPEKQKMTLWQKIKYIFGFSK